MALLGCLAAAIRWSGGFFIPAMQPFQQRVIDEKAELDAKLEKLAAFRETPTCEALDYPERADLAIQQDAMTSYSLALGRRIARFA